MFSLSLEIFKGKKILDNIHSLIEKARSEKALIVYIQYCGKENSPFYEGTDGWNIHPHVAPGINDIVLHKNFPDSF
jgi:nicotinamidase-related amidase